MPRPQTYSIASLLRHGLNHHTTWPRAWRSPPLKDSYDVIIIGAGGHGLATAYHLAHDHGITNVAVLERGWLGGGNIARNTVTIRSNYMRDASIPFYVKSVAMYEGLTRALNFNMMHSKRTMVDVVQTYPKLRELRRRQLTMDIYGATYEQISEAEVRRRIPALTGGGPDARLPIIGGMVHTDAGVNRHDAVAWGYARAIDAMGVEIHQQTPVESLVRAADGAITGVQTNKGLVRAPKVVVAVSGHTTTLTENGGAEAAAAHHEPDRLRLGARQTAGRCDRELPRRGLLFQPVRTSGEIGDRRRAGHGPVLPARYQAERVRGYGHRDAVAVPVVQETQADAPMGRASGHCA